MRRFAYREAASGLVKLLHDREFGIWWVRVWDNANSWFALSRLESDINASAVSTVFGQQAEKQWEELMRRHDEGEEMLPPDSEPRHVQHLQPGEVAYQPAQGVKQLEDTVAEKNTRIDELEMERDAMWAFARDLRRQLAEERQQAEADRLRRKHGVKG